ncbi:MAG TPA: alpha-E domain-containing protein [Mycobacteriales bacterium]|nr:alpha-E domain-containing protein [Mycobacteriales bacterium]
MLSRIAEALYWTGRYTERAEDTARLLDVAQRAALEGGDLGGSETLAALLGGYPISGSLADVITHYCLNRGAPESLASCVRAARENARTIRDAVTSEMWESLNTWHLQVAATSANELSGGGSHTFLAAQRTRAYLFIGSADASLPREEGWYWLMLGRWLERLTFTTRVLAVRAPTLEAPSDPLASATGGSAVYGWAVLLRALSAYEAFRGAHRAGLSPERVVEFLLLDRHFPRSARHAAMQVEDALVQVADEEVGSSARRIAGRLRSILDYRQVDDVFDEGLAPFVHRVADLTAEVHGALADEPFARAALSAASFQGGAV